MIQTRAINDLATIVRGVSYKPVDASETSKDGYVPLLRAMNIDEGILNLNDLIYVNPKRVSKLQRITKGDVVIAASTGSKKVIGKAAQSKNNWEGSFGAFCMVLRPNSQLIDVNYFGYFFQSVYYRKLISHMSSGANINNLKREYFDRLSIPIPSVSEQERIVTNLDQADSLRQKRKQAIDLLDEYLKSVFLEMFGDPMKNQKKWEMIKLAEVIIDGPQNGLYRPSTDYGSSGTPILRIDSFYDGKVTNMAKLKRVVIPEKIINLYQLNDEDIIINRVNSRSHLGKSALICNINEQTVYESNMMRFSINKRMYNSVYFIELLQTQYIKKQILNRAKDSVNQSSINQEDVKSFVIPMPPLDLQNKFAGVVQDTQILKQKMLEQSGELNNQFQALMQKSFNSN